MEKSKKELYREEFKRIDHFVKFGNVCEALNISSSNFAVFKAGDDRRLSLKALQRISEFIKNNYI